MKISGKFKNGDTKKISKWLNKEGTKYGNEMQSEVTRRMRQLSYDIQKKIDDEVAGGAVPFTKRAIIFNFIQRGSVRTNQIIVRGAQAAYLRSILVGNEEQVLKFVPTSDAKLTTQGNITGLRRNMNKKYKVTTIKGKKMLIDTSKKGKQKDKRIIGIREEKKRKLLFDFFNEAEKGARLALSTVSGTYVFTHYS